ncbi:unnamed protein product [Orchesella dallaii]|uniref:EamA domain-containing protein n=1 Tax=Orchesella dallaii TaxID=48710 RepID=A0ABP1Q761_9HEXA
MTILDTESGDFGSAESGEGVEVSSEHTPLLFPSLKPTLNYKDLQGHIHYGTGENSKTYGDEGGRKAGHKPMRGLRRNCKKYLGILLGISASFLLSLTTLIARVLIEYHPFNEALWRFLGILLPSVPILFWSSVSNKESESVFSTIHPLCNREKLKTMLVIFVRAFCGCTAVILQFYALNYIEIGDVTVISFTTPVFVSILAYFFLGEKLGVVPVLIALITLIGIGIITRPPILSGSQEFDPLNLVRNFLLSIVNLSGSIIHKEKVIKSAVNMHVISTHSFGKFLAISIDWSCPSFGMHGFCHIYICRSPLVETGSLCPRHVLLWTDKRD